MTNLADRSKVEDRAISYFENGYHCAEAVAASVLEQMGEDPTQALAHATAFGGGFGKSFEEACGALSGALIVIGHTCPRNGQGESWDRAAELGAEIRQRFITHFGTTHCGTLREEFGEDQSQKCGELTGRLAADLADLLQARTGD